MTAGQMIVVFGAGALAAWFGLRQRVKTRVTRGVQQSIQRAERKARMRRYAMIVGVCAFLVLIFVIWSVTVTP